jgi:hypothetical protein
MAHRGRGVVTRQRKNVSPLTMRLARSDLFGNPDLLRRLGNALYGQRRPAEFVASRSRASTAAHWPKPHAHDAFRDGTSVAPCRLRRGRERRERSTATSARRRVRSAARLRSARARSEPGSGPHRASLGYWRRARQRGRTADRTAPGRPALLGRVFVRRDERLSWRRRRLEARSDSPATLSSAAAVLAPCCHDPPEARNALQKGI